MGTLNTISDSINNQKNIREFLAEQLNAKKNQVLYLEAGSDGVSRPVYDVDVLWDGTNYYITYRTKSEPNQIYIKDLDSVLPLAIKPIS